MVFNWMEKCRCNNGREYTIVGRNVACAGVVYTPVIEDGDRVPEFIKLEDITDRWESMRITDHK